jgi:protein O-mannosyl-transferase
MSNKIKQNIYSAKQAPVNPEKNAFFSKNLLLLGILALTIIVFSNVVNNDFINWDDEVYVTVNKYIKDFSLEGITNIFKSYAKDELPITQFSFAIDYKIWGLTPRPYHVENVIFHLLNIILVFYFVFILTKRNEASLITALLFAIHPFRVESVTWVAERKDVLFTMFYLLALISYVFYLKKDRKITYFVLTLVFSILSILSKFTAATLPLILCLIDYYFGRKYTVKTILEKIPFFIMPVISGIIHYKSATGVELVGEITQKFSILDTIFIANYSLSFYLVKFLFPFNLCALHPYPLKTSGLLPYEYYLSPVIIIFFIFAFIKLANKTFIKKEMVFGILFFLITIALVLQVIPFGGKVVVGERYTYLPYIGLSFFAGQIYCMITDNKFKNAYRFRRYMFPLLIATALVFSVITFNRNTIYKDSFTFWNDVIEKYPDFYFGYFSLGNAKKYNKEFDVALHQYDKSIELNPEFALAYNNRGLTKQDVKDFKGAVDDFEKALKIKPDYDVAYYNCGLVKSDMNDYKSAIDCYQHAVKINPEYVSAWYNMGNARCMINDYQNAVLNFNKAIELNGKDAFFYCNRGLAKTYLKQYNSAIEDFNKALVYNPVLDKAFHNRGLARYNLGDFKESIEDFNRAIEQNPNYISAFRNRGLAELATNNKIAACSDWLHIYQSGYSDANDLISQYCNK